MARNYRQERDLIVERWYGRKPSEQNPRAQRVPGPEVVSPDDGYGVKIPVNAPYPLAGHCLMWRYSLNSGGYGIQRVGGRDERVHRLAYEQACGPIPQGAQINHLCNRPYCFQPSHLYAGNAQDNSDDAKLSRSGARSYGVIGLGAPYRGSDPLLQRLSENPRYPETEPWQPVEHPPQTAWDAFRCSHDFSIPQDTAGEVLWCRICDEAPSTVQFDEAFRGPALIASLWPVSQAVAPIRDAIYGSAFSSDSTKEQRIRAYRRSGDSYSGSHPLPTCSCEECVEDRRAFTTAIDGSLTDQMRMTIRVCDDVRPEIQRALGDAGVIGIRLLARREGLDDPGHVREMERHLAQCSAQQLADGRIQIERMLGGATYAALHDDPEEDVVGQLWFQMVDRWVSGGYVTEDIPDIVRALSPELPEAASGLIDRWREQLVDVSGGRVVPVELRAADLIFHSAYWGVVWILLDQARHDLTGTTSTGQRWPPPHDYCIEQVRTTGRWEDLSLPDPFEEGRGYRAGDDVQAMGSWGFSSRSQRASGNAMIENPLLTRRLQASGAVSPVSGSCSSRCRSSSRYGAISSARVRSALACAKLACAMWTSVLPTSASR